jgi:hypothetical protein
MANTVNAIFPRIFAKAMLALRPYVGMPRLVNNNFKFEASQKGKTIQIPIASAGAVKNVSPGVTASAIDDSTVATADVTLDQWKYCDFQISDDDVDRCLVEENFVPPVMFEKLKALAIDINKYISGLAVGVYAAVGTPGTALFGSNPDLVVDARKLLSDMYCPDEDRRLVLDTTASAALLKTSVFRDASQSGDAAVVQRGRIGTKYGFDFYESQNVQSFTGGTVSAGAITVNGVNAINAGSTDGGRTGTISLAKATNTFALKKGHIFTIAGFSQQYVVTADVTLAVGNTTVSIAPALTAATAGSEVVTLLQAAGPGTTNHTMNLAFHRDAIAFASRIPADNVKLIQDSMPVKPIIVPDPVTGLVFRLQVVRMHFQTAWFIDVLYGGVLARPEMACRIVA